MKETVLDNIDNNEDLISKIRELQKEVDRLNAQLKEKRFGLTWIDVPEAFEKESENKIPVLEEVPELAVRHRFAGAELSSARHASVELFPVPRAVTLGYP